MKKKTYASCLALAIASLVVTTNASAQDMTGGFMPNAPGSARSGPSSGRPDVENSPEKTDPVLSPRSVKLFDSRKSIVSRELDIGPIWFRKVQETTPQSDRTNFKHGAPLAGELAVGTVYTTPYKGFFMVGELKTLLRIVDDKSFSWAIFHQELGGGLSLGPFEPEILLRLSVLSVDIFHAEPSVQLFSPGVAFGLGIRAGKIRLDIKAHSEYLWRWFGPDYVIRGVTLGIRLDLTRPKSPYQGMPQ